MVHGVAEDVVEGAAQQHRPAGDPAAVARLESDLGPRAGAFEPGVADDLGEQCRQIELVRVVSGVAGLEPRQEQQLPDEVIEPAGLALDPVEGSGGGLTGAGPRQLESHDESRQRRPQLV